MHISDSWKHKNQVPLQQRIYPSASQRTATLSVQKQALPDLFRVFSASILPAHRIRHWSSDPNHRFWGRVPRNSCSNVLSEIQLFMTLNHIFCVFFLKFSMIFLCHYNDVHLCNMVCVLPPWFNRLKPDERDPFIAWTQGTVKALLKPCEGTVSVNDIICLGCYQKHSVSCALSVYNQRYWGNGAIWLPNFRRCWGGLPCCPSFLAQKHYSQVACCTTLMQYRLPGIVLRYIEETNDSHRWSSMILSG